MVHRHTNNAIQLFCYEYEVFDDMGGRNPVDKQSHPNDSRTPIRAQSQAKAKTIAKWPDNRLWLL
jgi:hypothetical protein